MRVSLLLPTTVALLHQCCALTLTSPDSRIQLNLNPNKLEYQVSFDGDVVLKDSTIALTRRVRRKMNRRARLNYDSHVVTDVDETWNTVWGTTSSVTDRYQQAVLTLTSPHIPDVAWTIRVYDQGIAYRLTFTNDNSGNEYMYGEAAVFGIASGSNTKTWATGRHNLFTGPFPLKKFNKRVKAMRKKKKKDVGHHTPITMVTNQGVHLAFHEAAVVEGTYVVSGVRGKALGLFGVHICDVNDDFHDTAWRTVFIADSAGGLIDNSIMTLNLNPPNALSGASWITTGKSVWDWRVRGAVVDGGSFTYELNQASLQRQADFASANGIEFLTVDAGWYGPEHESDSDPTTDIDGLDIPQLISYAGGLSPPVGVFLYINQIALRNFDMGTVFQQYQTWGAKGIKHGFLNTVENFEDIADVARETVTKCAEHELLYILHEPAKPTGWERTYPNFLSSEYARSLVDGAVDLVVTPTDACTMPFLAGLTGPLDRTPTFFDINNCQARDHCRRPIQSTIAAQVAQGLVYYSGLYTLPDHGESYSAKDDLFEFVRILPTTFDASSVLQGEIGQFIVTMRQSGDSFYLCGLTNEDERTVSVPLSFVQGNKNYDARLYLDGDDATYEKKEDPSNDQTVSYKIENETVTSSTVLSIRMAPGGGFCVWIR